MERITKAQFRGALNRATQYGREIGAIGEGEWIGTATAWTMDYLCVYDYEGRMVDSLGSRCGTTRELYERANAFLTAWQLIGDTMRRTERHAVSVGVES